MSRDATLTSKGQTTIPKQIKNKGFSEFEEFDLEGLSLWIHRQVILESRDQRRLRFHFGLMGWCGVNIL